MLEFVTFSFLECQSKGMSTPPPAINDDYGFFGPDYSFADSIPLPGEVGARHEASFGAILDSVGAVNYYMDTIAFGGPTFFDGHNPQPMGIRYYLNTGMKCSNGATMSEYYDGVTRGDLLGERVAAGLASAGLPGLKGLAPGMLENARDALDPRPIFAAVTASGYPVCQQVACPVGDVNGVINDPSGNPFIKGQTMTVNGRPYQTRWVQAYDSDGNPIQQTKDEFAATPKCYNADGSYMDQPPEGCAATEPAAGSSAGTGKYALCTVMRGGSDTTEGFVDDGGANAVAAALLVAVLGGIAIWGLSRNR
jgi:hypothetical protein